MFLIKYQQALYFNIETMYFIYLLFGTFVFSKKMPLKCTVVLFHHFRPVSSETRFEAIGLYTFHHSKCMCIYIDLQECFATLTLKRIISGKKYGSDIIDRLLPLESEQTTVKLDLLKPFYLDTPRLKNKPNFIPE